MSGLRRQDVLRDAVVVVTGASSGIGRATAIEFAKQGARLILTGRRKSALEETVGLCHAEGAVADAFVADMTLRVDLDRLVAHSASVDGRIDVWVNNAGTTLFGRLYEGDFAAHRQVLETNLVGPMYVARLLMPVFYRQRHGVLINVGSVLSHVGQAFVPAYGISKFGLRGLSEALRSDAADYPRIHVCTVIPYAVNTPHFEEGGNVIGRQPHAMPPVQRPEQVAKAIVRMAVRPRRERYVPQYIRPALAFHWLWPRTTERLLRHALQAFHFAGPQPLSDGGLFEPTRRDARMIGERPPLIGRLAFLGWALKDLGKMGLAWWRGADRPLQ